MSMINYASREINCKLVYYGPGLGGKTTNLEFVYNKVAPGSRGKMISLATETERTLFFDFLPIDRSNSYTDWLPNFSARFHITPELQLRASFTQTRTRPTFAQLNPSFSVGQPIGTCTPGGDPFACARSGGGGNPDLKPFKSNNYDLSLEYYFSRTGLAAIAVFRRDLKGFIQNQQIRTIDPEFGPLILNQPINTRSGDIKGVEAQFSTFFDWDWMPGFLQGFGAQANVTYLDTDLEDPIGLGVTHHRILGVSKWTYNLVGMYERGPLSVRLSYNNPGKRLETIQNRGNDLYIETSNPAGRLDLSASYTVNDNFTVFGDWTNILGNPFQQDFTSARDGAARSEYIRFLRFEETILSGGAAAVAASRSPAPSRRSPSSTSS